MMIETSIYRTNCAPLVMFTLLIIDHRLIVVDSRVEALPKAMENKYLIRELSKETPEQMNIPVDHEQIVRLPSNSLLKYTSYKDVAILHFRVPPDSRAAYFTFKAFEESKNAFQRKCKAKDVTLHLKASSYPVISPENITFPKNFFSPEQRFKVHSLQFQSNDLQQRIDIQGPHIGNWFAVAFVSWTDPNNDRIEQQDILYEAVGNLFQPVNH
ncbi:post-GPI attachment to proteins factor 6 isoform X3 [Drosophila pseudoobscura]|uniref:Post-GPI attachment to proteins factor 6 isoform X3 n=1 Tax=Drosophila pseudoobscura pseudoobscura TaxID=46245 RepID=A0A6I8VQU9_DROPS|nr:post-GPI attachment to proteins factor 6 isoform X3 [Drosophila pseudoobscura]